MNTILQIPINKNLRDRAASSAAKMGFSSLQEVVRVILNKVATGELNIKFEETVILSEKNDRRYAKMIDDIETGKAKMKTFYDVPSMMKYLNSED